MLGVMDDIVVTEIIMKTILHPSGEIYAGEGAFIVRKEEWIEIQEVIDFLI